MSGTGTLAKRIVENILQSDEDKLKTQRQNLIGREQAAATRHGTPWNLKAWAILDELLTAHKSGDNDAVAGHFFSSHTYEPYQHEASAIGMVLMSLQKYIAERHLTAYSSTAQALAAINNAAGSRSNVAGTDREVYTHKRFLEILGHAA